MLTMRILLLLIGVSVEVKSQLSQSVTSGSTNPCLSTFCPSNTRCVVRQEQYGSRNAVCERSSGTSGISEGFGSMTGSTSGRLSCASINCGINQQCMLQQTQCTRSPCYPVPQCVSVRTFGRRRQRRENFDLFGTHFNN